MQNFYLQKIWHKAKLELRECEKIYFCGYSFRDADMHIKYLLKRAKMYNERNPEIYIINKPKRLNEKIIENAKNEKERYFRFFKNKENIHYLDRSFEKYCKYGTEGVKDWNLK